MTAPPDRPPLATRQKVADYLGVPEATLAQWASKGTGPSYVRVGRHVRYQWADVEQWLAMNRAARS